MIICAGQKIFKSFEKKNNMSSFTLTSNGIAQINNGSTNPTTLQIIAIKELPVQGGQPSRHKIMLSDGVHSCAGMLATQLNNVVHSGQIKQFTVISVTDVMLNDVGKRKLVIVLGATVVGQSETKIGEPQKYDGGAGAGAAPSAPQSSSSSSAAPSGPGQQQQSHANKFTPKAQSSRASVSRSPDLGCTPIMQINPYANRWKIKGRITDISRMKTWNNARGEGKLMSVTILDKHGDDIKGTFFKENAGKYHPQDPECTQPLEKGGMYTFTGGRVKVANAKWNNCKSEYEITFNSNCEIVQVADDGDVQKVSYTRFPISQIADTEPGDRAIDVLGVVLSFEPHNTFTSKKGNEVTKRDLMIADESGSSIRCTLWGEAAFTPDDKFENNPVVLITRAKIGDYGGRSLSGAFSGGALEFNPTFAPECAAVQSWFQSGGADNVTALSSSSGGGTRVDTVETRKLMCDIDGENLGEKGDGKADFINVKGYVSFVKVENYCYPADPETRKKLIQDQSAGDNGVWRNEITGQEYDKPDWSYCLNVKLEDYTGGKYCAAFNKELQAQALVGYTANQLKQIEDDQGEKAVTDILESIKCQQHKFTLMVKMDQRSEEARKEIHIFRVDKLNYADENSKLLTAIGQYDAM